MKMKFASQGGDGSGVIFYKLMCKHGWCCKLGEIMVRMVQCSKAESFQLCGDGAPIKFELYLSTFGEVVNKAFMAEFERLMRAYKSGRYVRVEV